jgi:PilZ domain
LPVGGFGVTLLNKGFRKGLPGKKGADMYSPQAATERRANKRIPVSVGAVLYYNSLMLPDCHIRDLSSQGAFILTGGQSLPDRANVDLAFAIPAAYGMPPRVTAQVIRSTGYGVGIRLAHVDPAMLRSLSETLYVL